ncbi:MAG: protein-L-isoaspartate(D-aspartate) O-methyltransferase [Sedimentisphaerales bacterium]|nr:protein-L-isoaspartate(D-aspartate) O-methyltransferase [Sedimentisphaerales bacterium]
MVTNPFQPDDLFRTRRMVADQIRSRDVRDERVLGVMECTPRGHFVPPSRREQAWLDQPVPIGHGQTISQPYIVGLMTEKLDVRPEHEVLEIGTGCGYQTVILAQLCRRVFTMEYIEALGQQGRANVEALGLSNVEYAIGDGHKGWPTKRTFDRILVAAAAEQIPLQLLAQLADEGKMVLPIGPPSDQQLMLLEKTTGGVKQTLLCYCRFVPLVGE